MSCMVCIERVRNALPALLAGLTLFAVGLAHSAPTMAAPAPAATITPTPSTPSTAAVQTVPGAPPPLAPDLPPANPASLSPSVPGPAAPAVSSEPVPAATAPGRMSPTAPMVQSGASVPASTPAPAASAATAAVASAGSLTQVALVLLLVVGLIAGAAWLLKRLGMVRNPGGSTVRIVSGVSLSNRERILVVEVADQWIVVGVAPGCINTLATMPRQEPASINAGPGMQAPASSNFALWLKQTMDKRSGNEK